MYIYFNNWRVVYGSFLHSLLWKDSKTGELENSLLGFHSFVYSVCMCILNCVPFRRILHSKSCITIEICGVPFTVNDDNYYDRHSLLAAEILRLETT